MAEQTKPPSGEQGDWYFLPLGLAVVAGIIQIGTCGTRIVGLGTRVGLFLSVVAILSGHVVLWRSWRAGGELCYLAWIALALAYLSLFILPIVGYGILFLTTGGSH